MKKVVIAVACIASLMVAKECKTMADLINGCVKTEYNYDKKPIKQSEWKNKKEVRVIYEKTYHSNGNLASDCSGNVCKTYHENGKLKSNCQKNGECKNYNDKGIIENEVSQQDGIQIEKRYDENGAFLIIYRDGKPFHGKFKDYANEGEYANGLKTGVWKEETIGKSGRQCSGTGVSENCSIGIWKEKTFADLVEIGEYVNGEKSGVWKLYDIDSNQHLMDGQFKSGKLISITLDNITYKPIRMDRDYSSLISAYAFLDEVRLSGNEREWQATTKKCTETLIPDKNGKTNPNNKIENCYLGKKRNGINKVTIEYDIGFFMTDMKVETYDLYFDNGVFNPKKSKCPNGRAMETLIKPEKCVFYGKECPSEINEELLKDIDKLQSALRFELCI